MTPAARMPQGNVRRRASVQSGVASSVITVQNSLSDAPNIPPRRRPFAAKYAHRGWGIGLGIFGALAIISGFGSIPAAVAGTTSGSPLGSILLGLASLAVAVYLLRGQGENPAAAAKKAAAAQRQSARSAADMNEATAALGAAAAGGAAVVAFRNLEATATSTHGRDASAKTAEALSAVGFNPAVLDSPRFGVIPAVGGGMVEVYRDWVIFGQETHDVDATTRGQVFADGSIQVTSAVITDKRKKSQVVNQEHDLRTATLQITSAMWSMSIPIDPNHTNDARRMVDQLAAHVESLKPQSATSADIRAMVETILGNTGQPPAEKLRQLSNLRFEQLLTDDEFEAAKARILGIQ